MSSETKSLISAIVKGEQTKVETLISDGIDLNETTNTGLAAIHICVVYNRHNLLRLLLQNGVNLNSKTKNNETALHLAAVNGHFECVELLLKYGIDVNIKSIEGNTALHLSIIMKAANGGSESNTEIVEFNNIIEALISHEDIDLSTRMQNGFDCLTFAITADDYFTVGKLLQKSPDLFYKKKDEHYPLHIATIFGHCSIVDLMLNLVNDANIKNDHGLTALHYAVLLRKAIIVELLVSKGINCDEVDNDRNTALHFALIKANDELKSSTFESIDFDNYSKIAIILERLMCTGIKKSISLAIAGYLIEEGFADYLKENNYGLIPLDMIRQQEFYLRSTFIYIVLK